MFFWSVPFNLCEDTTNFADVHVHLPEIRRKAGLVGHTGHHYTTSTPHLAGQLRVGEAAQDRGPRRCLSHPWSMSITFYHRTYHFNGSSMFKHVQTEWWQVMMPTCQRPALSLEQSGVECMAQTDQRDCQVSHMPCKCVVCSGNEEGWSVKALPLLLQGRRFRICVKVAYQPGFMDVSRCFTLEQSPSLANRFCHVGIRWVDAVSEVVALAFELLAALQNEALECGRFQCLTDKIWENSSGDTTRQLKLWQNYCLYKW